MSQLTLTRTINSQLDSVPISDGQLIFISDSPSIFWDVDGARKVISDIIILSTEEEKNELLAPLNKFYYIIETSSLYYYEEEWKKVAGRTEEYIAKVEYTLSKDNWTNNTYTITDSRLTTNTDGDLDVADNITDTQYIDITESKLSRNIQLNNGSIVITALNSSPSIDIPIVLKVKKW